MHCLIQNALGTILLEGRNTLHKKVPATYKASFNQTQYLFKKNIGYLQKHFEEHAFFL